MSKSIVDVVIETLQNAGVSARRAMPAQSMGELKGITAAVQLHQLDQSDKTAMALVSVLVPAALGASACEDGALQICRILQGAGGMCRQERVEYLSEMDAFCGTVYAAFAGEDSEQGWIRPEDPLGFSVSAGDVLLHNVVSFTAQRAVDENMTALSDAVWHFRLEEEFPLDAVEEAEPAEPFSVTVIRQGRTEVYYGCTVTSHKRSISENGQQQIREGVAAERTVSES